MKKPRQRKPSKATPSSVEKNSDTVGDLPDGESQDLAAVLEDMPDIPPEDRIKIMQAASFSGPMPPPAMLAHYEEILPGCADRIMSMAEREQALRGRDNRKFLHNERLIICGSILVSLTLIGAGGFAIYIGSPYPGTLIAIAGVVAGVIKLLRKEK